LETAGLDHLQDFCNIASKQQIFRMTLNTLLKLEFFKVLNEDLYCVLECYCLLPAFVIILPNLYKCLIDFTKFTQV